MKPHYLNKSTQNLALSAIFIAIGIVLPFFTGQLQQIGNMLLPMHLPVLLCGLICGWQYGAAVGFILPPLRYLMFAAPPIFPIGAAMAVELAAYGLIAGFLYNRSRWQCIISLYRSLIAAMIGGRLVWGIARVLMTGVSGEAFTWQMFLSGALLTAIPGIMIQLVFIPAFMGALDRTGMVHFRRESHHAVTES